MKRVIIATAMSFGVVSLVAILSADTLIRRRRLHDDRCELQAER